MRSVIRVGLGLFCFSTFGGIFSSQTPPAIAQCVQADVSVQYNISGSRKPTRRTNDVDMQSDPGCVGNTSVTTGIQGNVGGTAPVEQHRQVRHRQTGGDNPGYGVPGNTVQVKTNVGIDVYNPADNFQY
jgi:hypothetical protein